MPASGTTCARRSRLGAVPSASREPSRRHTDATTRPTGRVEGVASIGITVTGGSTPSSRSGALRSQTRSEAHDGFRAGSRIDRPGVDALRGRRPTGPKKKSFLRRKWWLLLLLTPLVLMAFAGHRPLRRLRAHHAARDAAADPDHLPVRPQRASAHDAARGGRSHAGAPVADLAAHDRRRDRHRGPRLLQPPRRRRRRHPARRLHRRREAQHGAGRLDAHRAAREERLRRFLLDRRQRRADLRRSRSVRSRRRSARRCSR